MQAIPADDARSGGCAATGRGGWSTNCWRCSSRCWCCSRPGWCCSTPRRAIASSSTASPRSRPRRGSTSASAGSTDRSSASRRLQECRGCRSTGGVFLTSPEIELDWAPGAWLYNSLHIDRLSARPGAAGARCPSSRPTGRRGPILPGFDIHIGELAIRPARACARRSPAQARSGRVRGKADIRAGRAMVELGRGDRRRRRPHRVQPRRRARPRPLRSRRRAPNRRPTGCFRRWSGSSARST